MHPAAVEFSGVNRQFGSRRAAADVSFAVGAGESVALVGVNGAGKTTLLRCMLDYCRADSGTIRVFGVPSTRAEARSRLAWLPERFSPPYYLTGRDYLRYHASLRGAAHDEEAALERLRDLDFDPEALERPARTFSKGMLQKLGLAACLLARRPLTVLDEPMSGLDPLARSRVRSTLGQLRADGGALLFSSHALEDVAALCDRLVVIHGGRVAFAGTPAQLCARSGTTVLEQAFLQCIGASAA
jgi:ABC-2 type transport system ATP-binding protein